MKTVAVLLLCFMLVNCSENESNNTDVANAEHHRNIEWVNCNLNS